MQSGADQRDHPELDHLAKYTVVSGAPGADISPTNNPTYPHYSEDRGNLFEFEVGPGPKVEYIANHENPRSGSATHEHYSTIAFDESGSFMFAASQQHQYTYEITLHSR